MSARRAAVVAIAVLAVAGVAWFVAAPLRTTPARAVPDADIDTTTGPARPVPMPETPHIAAAASAASAAHEDPASCGEDQLPKNGELGLDAEGHVAPAQSRLAGVGFTGAQHRLDASLRASADPFSRGLADWLNLGGVFASPEARTEALVQDALASDDARTYDLAFRICTQPSSPGSCARLSTREWARRDPGNGLPWLYELVRADHAGDAAAQSFAMDRLADATRFDVHAYAGAAVAARLKLASPADLAAQHLAASLALAALPTPEYDALLKHCPDGAGGDPQRRGACERIAQTLSERSDALVPRAIGGAIHKHLTGDASALDRAKQDGRFFFKTSSEAGADTSPCRHERQELGRMIELDSVGEVALALQARNAAAAASAASR